MSGPILAGTQATRRERRAALRLEEDARDVGADLRLPVPRLLAGHDPERVESMRATFWPGWAR